MFETRRHGRVQLYIINADGTAERRLTRSVGDDTHPAWSPDGSTIVFDSTRDGSTWNLYTIRPDGTGEHRLTTPGANRTTETARHPQWSPDGRRLVLDSTRDGDEEIYVMDADDTTVRRLTFSPGRDGHASFTPDGRILFSSSRSGDEEVWIMASDGSGQRPLTNHPGPDRSAKMSPDGRTIVFNTERDGNAELYAMNADGTSIRNLTQHADTVFECAWSPDSKSIAFYSDRLGRFEIFVMSAAGGPSRQLTNASYHNAFPAWLPDGHIIYSSTQDGGDWEIYRIGADGSGMVRLTSSLGRDAHPQAWTEGRVLFQSPRAWSDTSSVDIFAMNVDGTQVRRITAHPTFNGVPVPSRDGTRIAFMRGVPTGVDDYHWNLMVMDATGDNERPLTAGVWSSQVPTWTPDSAAVLFYANPDGRNQLYRLDLTSARVIRLHESRGNDHAPSLSADGRIVAFTSDRDTGSDRHDLYTLELATGHLRRLTTDLNVRGQPGWSRDGSTLVISAAPRGVFDIYVIKLDGTGLRRVTRGFEGDRLP